MPSRPSEVPLTVAPTTSAGGDSVLPKADNPPDSVPSGESALVSVSPTTILSSPVTGEDAVASTAASPSAAADDDDVGKPRRERKRRADVKGGNKPRAPKTSSDLGNTSVSPSLSTTKTNNGQRATVSSSAATAKQQEQQSIIYPSPSEALLSHVISLRQSLHDISMEIRQTKGHPDVAKVDGICATALGDKDIQELISKAKQTARNKQGKGKKSSNARGQIRGNDTANIQTSNNNGVDRRFNRIPVVPNSGNVGFPINNHGSTSWAAGQDESVRTLSSAAESDHPICVRIREGLRLASDKEAIEALISQAESHKISDLVDRGKRKLKKLDA